MFSFTVAQELYQFGVSLLLGAALGVFYDIFRILRVAIPSGKVLVFIEDTLFFVSAAFLAFQVILQSGGAYVGIYMVLGMILGFVIYYFTFGVIVFRLAHAIIGGIKFVISFIGKRILLPIGRLLLAILRQLVRPLCWVGALLYRQIKKVLPKCKKALQNVGTVVYTNNKRKISNRVFRRKRRYVGRKKGRKAP